VRICLLKFVLNYLVYTQTKRNNTVF